MIRTLIVDDETLLRATLRSLIDWPAQGYLLEPDCCSGKQALEQLRKKPVDFLITDMRMPNMDGLELMRTLRTEERLPVTVALSGYDEFELVREAFRLGAYDYLLKENLTAESLTKLLSVLQEKVFSGYESAAVNSPTPELAPGNYGVVLFEVADLAQWAVRLGDVKERLEKPMIELARQTPRLAGRAVIRSIGPGQIVLCWQVRDSARYYNTIHSIARQLQAVWRDYMNVSVSAAISQMVTEQGIEDAIVLCTQMLPFAALHSAGVACSAETYGVLAAAYREYAPDCDALAKALCSSDKLAIQQQSAVFFDALHTLDGPAHTQRILVLLARLGEVCRQCGENSAGLADSEAAVAALQSAGERELWLHNRLRKVEEYFDEIHRRTQTDPLQKAYLFMKDNYADPALTLKSVADYVGYNEKYFSAQFTKRFGCTFISSLNRLRLQRAQELLLHSERRIYEISESVGYNSVEHFNHTFKKYFGISPKDYRAQRKNSLET